MKRKWEREGRGEVVCGGVLATGLCPVDMWGWDTGGAGGTDGWMEEQMDGCMDSRTDGRTG